MKTKLLLVAILAMSVFAVNAKGETSVEPKQQAPEVQNDETPDVFPELLGTWEAEAYGYKYWVTFYEDGTYETSETTDADKGRSIWRINRGPFDGMPEEFLDNIIVIKTGSILSDGTIFFSKGAIRSMWAYTYDKRTGVLSGGGGEYTRKE